MKKYWAFTTDRKYTINKGGNYATESYMQLNAPSSAEGAFTLGLYKDINQPYNGHAAKRHSAQFYSGRYTRHPAPFSGTESSSATRWEKHTNNRSTLSKTNQTMETLTCSSFFVTPITMRW
jgi:hypothetical protein